MDRETVFVEHSDLLGWQGAHHVQGFGRRYTDHISFVSDAFPGAISDPASTHQSGLLNEMEEGDFIMADKGFTLTAADLQPHGIKLALLPFQEGDKQMLANLVVKIPPGVSWLRTSPETASTPSRLSHQRLQEWIVHTPTKGATTMKPARLWT